MNQTRSGVTFTDDAADPLFRMLARLEAAVPSASREDRVRARCHAILARRHRRRPAAAALPLVAAALAAAFGLYLSEAVREALGFSQHP